MDWDLGWVGHLSDLLEAKSHFARMLAATFRGSEAYGVDEASPEEIRPVDKDEFENFIAFIQGDDMLNDWDFSE